MCCLYRILYSLLQRGRQKVPLCKGEDCLRRERNRPLRILLHRHFCKDDGKGEAIGLYKSRDASEKLFRGDKSYLGNKSLRVYSDESASAKIFIEFVALIIRSKIYTSLKDEVLKNDKKANFMTVSAALKELDKIEMVRQFDGVYRLDHAVSATQKAILKAFDVDEPYIKTTAKALGEEISHNSKAKQN